MQSCGGVDAQFGAGVCDYEVSHGQLSVAVKWVELRVCHFSIDKRSVPTPALR